MVDRKKTFYGYDYTLCDYSHCPNCNNCVRYLTHLKAVEEKTELYNYLLPYSKGARCTFPGWKCNSPCIFGAKNAMKRII